jgi:hypothetical protein
MADQHLRTLQLEPDQIEAAADFFEGYASFIQSTASDINGENSLVDAASSLRSAGQWAMLLDPYRATDLFRTSARIWYRMGYGFGTFLLAAFSPGQLRQREMADRLTQLAQPYAQGRLQSSEEQQLPEPLLHPQQQAYLLLAGAGMSRQMELPEETLHIFADRSPHRRGVAPIGSLGTPLRVYWDIARHFLDDDDEQTAALVARDLAGIAASYAETIDSAMANQRLWFNAAAPVDVGDIDTAALAMIAARRLGFDLVKAHLRSVTTDLVPIARVPIELSIEMIEREEPEQGPTNTTLLV